MSSSRLFSSFLLVINIFLVSNAHSQTFSTIYSFTGKADGGGPQGQLIVGANGALFGAANWGGNFSCASNGCGTVFELTSTGTLNVLHTFSGTDGWAPSGNMVLDSSNDLFGTTGMGGYLNIGCTPQSTSQGCGVIFKLNHVTGQFSVLHRFAGGADGAIPYGVVRDSAGNLYGTTFIGGIAGCANNGTCGTIYKLEPSGKHTVLYNFTGGTDGGLPISVIRDEAGNLYGTTIVGGDLNCQPNTGSGSGCGTVFEFTTDGTLKVLHSFTGGKDGQNSSAVADSNAGLIRNSAGILFGTSPLGGLHACKGYPGCGVVFQIDAAGKDTVLYSFGGVDGAQPTYTLTSDSSGNLYGTTTLGGNLLACPLSGCGTVFKLDASGVLTTLYTFIGNDASFYPTNLSCDPSGNLYGETSGGGGDFGTAGTIFEITP
jgi:uncharacterized repeat protein (TIGR03803 family)